MIMIMIMIITMIMIMIMIMSSLMIAFSDRSGRSFHFNAATFQGNEAGESF